MASSQPEPMPEPVTLSPDEPTPGVGLPRPPAARHTILELARVSKVYTPGAPPAVDDVSLTIGEGEFFSLLGPSGWARPRPCALIAGSSAPPRAGLLGGPT